MQRKEGGYRTKQKSCLLAYLETHADRHVTAAELVQALASDGTPVGTATVYRHLERLESDGLVRRYALDDRGSACWQYAGAESGEGGCRSHFHLKCTACGTLFHLDCDHLNEIAAHVAAEHGFAIDPGRTVFYGMCKTCAENAAGPR